MTPVTKWRIVLAGALISLMGNHLNPQPGFTWSFAIFAYTAVVAVIAAIYLAVHTRRAKTAQLSQRVDDLERRA